MKEKDLKHRLQQTFDFSIWKEILPLFFKKIDYFSHPENVFPNDDKVIDGKQIGTVKLDDGKQLAIFTVEVADSISIVRNRQGLREIAAKHIDQNIIHGALAFFYNKNQVDYRFSFIAKEASLDLDTGELIKGETKPKRYTYLLGSNEACATPAKRMLVLADKREKGEVNIKELKEVFSVEALNKDFFKSYKAHYEKFAKHLADESNPFRAKLIDTEKDTKDKEEKPIRDFVKKLLGRIVFLQFLEKKGWMGVPVNDELGMSNDEWTGGDPRFLYHLFENCPDKDHFHSKYLTVLFFNTLNTKREGDLAPEGLIHNSSFITQNSKIPYLNGGLFEPEKNKATLDIDFPAEFFKELLEFFDQYNFTIDENSPDDHEVGIDPEMLGHIFENLLEDNRDKGAFYTPKEIVQYMCKESLIQYLLNTFQQQKDLPDGKAGIEAFIRFHTVSPLLAEKENALLLNQKLDDIKVCDPAIGSGAFPIGMLQEIFEAKRFIYPYLKTNQDFKPAEVKKNIIQNSIYGVDLEKGAVDIAQLRFWLSLVVDELNPHPLPNLDYKIMQGNSLLEQFQGIDLSKMGKTQSDVQIVEPVRDLFGNLTESQMKMTFSKSETTDKIQKLIKRFFSIEKAEDKKAIRDEINALVLQHIEYNIELREIQLNRFINEAGNYDTLTKNAKKKYDGYVADLAKIQDTKTQLLKIQETDERPYFLWHLYFMDVFEQGGFDVMIGNPPYIQLQKMGKETDILQEARFETFARTGDIYCLFYEKGIDLLKKGGSLTYISGSAWLRSNYGKSLRKFFIQKTNGKILIDLSDAEVFESATVLTTIKVLKKEKNQNQLKAFRLTKRNQHLIKSLAISFEKSHAILSGLTENGWVIADQMKLLIKNQVAAQGVRLKDWNIEIYRGILTGFNEAFIIDEAKKEELIAQDPKSAELIKPLLRGRDLRKYGFEYTGIYLIATFPSIQINIQDYPAINSHLLSFGKSKLEQTGNFYSAEDGSIIRARKKTSNQWFETQDQISYWRNFEQSKIIYPNMVKDISFAYDDEGYYTNQKCFILTGKNLKYLLAILNSKLFRFCFEDEFPELQGNSREINKVIFEQIPIKLCNASFSKFDQIVDYILSIRKSQAPVLEKISNEAVIEVFEDLVNLMVYELYFEEEMKAKEIDVLQFVTEKAFPDITQAEDPKATIQKVYYELQQKDNPIRNRILVASSRSETIARINAATS